MKEDLSNEKSMEKASTYMKMEINIKDRLSIIKSRDMVNIFLKRKDGVMLVIGRKISIKEKEDIHL